ncbi:MAG: P-II family nitrogen regulator [Nitrospirales bacterium]|nr:MAG: P-II family nitrogen regulator [Nitrospirales bacterium]
MSTMKLYPMKEIKIILEGEHLHFVTDVLDRIKASGYMIFSNISGKGHGGFHEGHLMFNDTSSLQMVLTVVPEEKLEPILSGLKPFLERHSGSLFVLDASVLRKDHFDSAES